MSPTDPCDPFDPRVLRGKYDVESVVARDHALQAALPALSAFHAVAVALVKASEMEYECQLCDWLPHAPTCPIALARSALARFPVTGAATASVETRKALVADLTRWAEWMRAEPERLGGWKWPDLAAVLSRAADALAHSLPAPKEGADG